MTVLDQILATKRDEVTVLHRPQTADLLRRTALDAPSPRGFATALQGEHVAVIAELKRRSPSKGELNADLDPATTAKDYAADGAVALSVLTDHEYFGGTVDDLHNARGACELPVLRKDFTIDEIQVYETRAIGADAILLIVAALPDDAVLRDLHALALELELSALVEAHDDAELDRALDAGARIVGVNSRDLATFDEDLSVGERLVQRIPSDVLAVAESAIRALDDVERMARAGFEAVLVGEAFARASDASATVRAFAAVPRVSRR